MSTVRTNPREAVLALAALPAVSQADHGNHKGAGKGHHSGCLINRGFVVKGTLVDFKADDTSTAGCASTLSTSPS